MYTTKKISNGNTGLFYNNVFCGILSKYYDRLSQFSGNNDQIFNAELCAKYMLQFHDKVYSKISYMASQNHLIITANPYELDQGCWFKHSK